jgi:hypothetical protein
VKIVSRGLCIVLLVCPALVAQSGRGTLYVRPNSSEPPPRVSPGQFYNPATLTLKIDKRPPIPWPHKESVKIDDLDVKERHLVVLTSDGRNVQSFWFRFSDYKTTDLCIGFDGYQGVQLHEKNSPLCKCQ